MATIYIDLDGVVADFELRYTEVTGRLWLGSEPSAVRWARLKGKEEGFYAGIRPYPWAKSFVERVQDLASKSGLTVATLSALPSVIEFPTAKDEKLDWVEKTFPEIEGSYLAKSSSVKWKFATPGSIIIDDNPRNVAQWMKFGGIAIRHLNFEDSLVQLEEVLK